MLNQEAVDASAMPYRMAVAEISAAIFVGASSGRFRKTGEALKCADGRRSSSGIFRQEKGVAFCDSLAGLKGGSPHLGAGAKRPARVEGKALAQSVTGTVT